MIEHTKKISCTKAPATNRMGFDIQSHVDFYWKAKFNTFFDGNQRSLLKFKKKMSQQPDKLLSFLKLKLACLVVAVLGSKQARWTPQSNNFFCIQHDCPIFCFFAYYCWVDIYITFEFLKSFQENIENFKICTATNVWFTKPHWNWNAFSS